MLELLVGSVLTSAVSRMVTASITGRDMNSEDAASIATNLLQAVVSAQAHTNESLAEIEKKLDGLRAAPYVAAMAAGQRLLNDAAPPHRTANHRGQLLSEARTQFAIAVGNAPTPIAAAQAEVFYGLTWLSDGSVVDAVDAQRRAALLIEDELVTTHAMAVAEEAEYLRREAARQTAQGKFKEFFTGPPMPYVSAGDGFDRLFVAHKEHAPLQRLRRETGWGDHGYPVDIPAQKGTTYDDADSMVTVPFVGTQPLGAFGTIVALDKSAGPGSTGAVRVANHRSEPLQVSLSMTGVALSSPTLGTGLRALLERRDVADRPLAHEVPAGQTKAIPFAFPSPFTAERPLEIRLQFGPFGQKGRARFLVEAAP